MSHPIQFGNIIMILLGLVLLGSGPYIVFRTWVGVRKQLKDPVIEKNLWFAISNLINVLIGILFSGAGVLFILNNLRGNPLA